MKPKYKIGDIIEFNYNNYPPLQHFIGEIIGITYLKLPSYEIKFIKDFKDGRSGKIGSRGSVVIDKRSRVLNKEMIKMLYT